MPEIRAASEPRQIGGTVYGSTMSMFSDILEVYSDYLCVSQSLVNYLTVTFAIKNDHTNSATGDH